MMVLCIVLVTARAAVKFDTSMPPPDKPSTFHAEDVEDTEVKGSFKRRDLNVKVSVQIVKSSQTKITKPKLLLPR